MRAPYVYLFISSISSVPPLTPPQAAPTGPWHTPDCARPQIVQPPRQAFGEPREPLKLAPVHIPLRVREQVLEQAEGMLVQRLRVRRRVHTGVSRRGAAQRQRL